MPFRALIDACWKEKYTSARFTRDLIAGITVGIIAIPLAMALAIGSGVPPQYGLYTSAVAGIVIALTGGSRFSVSGPTAAFVVILYPVSQQFGLAGLLVATLMSGIFLILFGLARFGRLIEYIPLSVTLGFTSGIGITIGTMQIKDFLGLQMPHVPEHYLQKVAALAMALPTINVGNAAIGVVTLGILILWPRLGIRLPGHLPALLGGCAVMLVVNLLGGDVATIGSQFHYQLADGTQGNGIPQLLPQLVLPWDMPGSNFTLSWASLQALLPAAFSMAMLGAIESLLCAVVLDGMTGTKHKANSELIGQGLGKDKHHQAADGAQNDKGDQRHPENPVHLVPPVQGVGLGDGLGHGHRQAGGGDHQQQVVDGVGVVEVAEAHIPQDAPQGDFI